MPKEAALSVQDRINCGKGRLRAPICSVPCSRSDRRRGVETVVADGRIDPIPVLSSATDERESVRERVARPSCCKPVGMSRLQEPDVAAVMNPQIGPKPWSAGALGRSNVCL